MKLGTLAVGISILLSVAAAPGSARADSAQDGACWKPAFTDCVATTDGSKGAVKGCDDNYRKCMTTGAQSSGVCQKEALSACVKTTAGDVAGVTGCHDNLVKCEAGKPSTADDGDAFCWKAAYTDCAGTGNAKVSKGCFKNYEKCVGTKVKEESKCWKGAFTDCVKTTGGDAKAITGCHDNYVKCVAK